MQFDQSIRAVTMATEGADAMATQAVTATAMRKGGGGLNVLKRQEQTTQDDDVCYSLVL